MELQHCYLCGSAPRLINRFNSQYQIGCIESECLNWGGTGSATYRSVGLAGSAWNQLCRSQIKKWGGFRYPDVQSAINAFRELDKEMVARAAILPMFEIEKLSRKEIVKELRDRYDYICSYEVVSRTIRLRSA